MEEIVGIIYFSWMTTALIRMSFLQLYQNVRGKTSKVLQLRVVELRRAVQRAASRIQTKVSQCRMCDDQFVHCSVEK